MSPFLIFVLFSIVTVASTVKADNCGGVIADSTGGISYKPFESVGENERCVWIIHPDNTTNFEVTVDFLGFSQEDDQQLIITSMATLHSPVHTLVNSTGTYKFDRRTILLVTFASGPNTTANGFFLQYSSVVNPSLGVPWINPDSNFVIVSPDQYHLSYLNLIQSEYSLYIFPPAGGVYNAEKQTKLVYIRNGPTEDRGCEQDLEKFFFNPDSEGKWERVGRICDDTASDLATHSDLIMVIVETGRDPGPGFHFVNSVCE